MSFNVIRHHRWWFVISSILVIISLISIFTKGFNFGIDYTGGTIVEVQFTKPVEVSQVRDVLKTFDLENAQIQLSGDTAETAGEDVMIRTRNLEPSESAAVVEKLNSDIGENTVKRIETVGAVIGSEVTQHALLNLVIAFAVLALYISYRFEYRIAASALTAIFHDLIMVLGVFSFFQLEIDASFLAAILTVVGYSMNESVVIFDRVRENFRKIRRLDTIDIIDISLTQTLSRTIITSVTTLVVVIALFFFGGPSIHNFSLALLVGIGFGTYSSIFVAIAIAYDVGLRREHMIPPKVDKGIDGLP